YWVRFEVQNNLTTNIIGLNHSFNREKKLYVKNSLGVTEYPYWKRGEHKYLGEGRIGAQYRIVLPQNKETIIYDFFRSKPFDRTRKYEVASGLSRMMLGLWGEIQAKENLRVLGSVAFLTPVLLFGFYYFFMYLVSGGNYLWISLILFQASVIIFFSYLLRSIGIDFKFINSEMRLAFLGLLFLLMIQFFRKALNLRADFPRINKLFLLGICFFGFITILNFITSLSWPHEEQMNLIKYPPDSLGPGIIKPYQIFIPFGILLLLSIILSFISWRKGNSASGYLCLSFMLPFLAVPLVGVVYLIFREHFYLIMPSATGFLLLSMFVTFGFSVAQNMNDLKRLALEKQMRLTEAYQRFVPSQLLSSLEKESILDVQLGDQVQKEMSILFSDIRSFTTLSESMTPEENFRFVNSYLSLMGPLVREHHGYIDKYVGDSIMALFDRTPDDAVQTSISMFKVLREFNEERLRNGYEPIRIGVGVNTGMMMLGTLGEEDRMEGSVISDAVNLAARLEGLTKLYKTQLLISEATYKKLTLEVFKTRLIDKVAVKGKESSVLVYEVLDSEAQELFEKKHGTIKLFEQGFDLYQNQRFEEALPLFCQCLELAADDTVAALYVERCQNLISGGWNTETWDGVNRMETK
ncbi:MAG: adenylate/guanylate cyclase domain-containing protein, partial [SAR324 cluster bacterium]|nr:adenylate/guanylate cyclase domain-containing protein [SAR324 cluster bacterium]